MKIITLSNNKGEVLVDDEDFEWLDKYDWYLMRGKKVNYAYAYGKNIKGSPKFLIHRLILNAPKGIDVDHINGDGLNNQKCNLRLATRSQNLINRNKQSNNTSGIKGVSYCNEKKRKKKWKSSINHNSKPITIGRFLTKEEAGRAYDKKAKELYGEFAYINH